MKTVVITGSTRGIGFGLAKEFITLGCNVVISGSSENSVNAAKQKFNSSTENIAFKKCNVKHKEDITELWDFAKQKYGQVDIWINNAGLTHSYQLFKDLSIDEIENVIDTNVKSLIVSTRIIIGKMQEQGFGAIYGLEGFGSDGRKRPKMIIYGTSKSAVKYFIDSLILEMKKSDVIIGTIMPGMVLTDLLLDQLNSSEEKEQLTKIYNILAEKPETVTPIIAHKVLNNKKQGKTISVLSSAKIFWRFLTAPVFKRNIVNIQN